MEHPNAENIWDFKNPSRVALILTNYNMPERTNALVEYIRDNCMWPVDYYVVDNASDLINESKYTSLSLAVNRQTCGGWLAGLNNAREWVELMKLPPYFAYWIMITSAEFLPGSGDVLSCMCNFLLENPDAVAIHPALTRDSTTTWAQMITIGGLEPRRTFMVDNIAALYRADWFDSIGWFDPELTYAWGVDLESCWKARSQGKSIWIDERVRVKKVTDIGYKMERMNMSADSRFKLAADEAQRVLSNRYGGDFLNKLRYEYTEDKWLGTYPGRI